MKGQGQLARSIKAIRQVSAAESRIMVAPPTAERASELAFAHQKVNDQVRLASSQRVGTPARLVAVSKRKPSSDILALYDVGVRHFGENYVQELVDKAAELPSDIHWHFIGALQSNKCKTLASVPNLFALETLSTIKSADLLEKSVASLDPQRLTRLNVFLQVNTSGEDSKAGLLPLTTLSHSSDDSASEVYLLAKYIVADCPHLRLKGLMTIGSFTASTSSETNPDFESLKQTRSRLIELLVENGSSAMAVDEIVRESLELSMGMSNDFAEAIKQGSSNVRVGSLIFGERA